MKATPLVFVACLGAVAVVRSQVPSTTEPADSTPAAARILGHIPDGTPPPPSAPKPEYAVPQRDILQTATHQQGGRTITIRGIKPIALPPPAPPAKLAAEPGSEFSARLAAYREAHPRSCLLILSATVYRSAGSPPRTLVRYWPEGIGEPITFWSSADFALVSGIHSFADSAGQTHSLLMGWGYVEIDRLTDLAAAKGRDYDVPEIPVFPEGKATFRCRGTQPDAEDLIAIQSLHDLYNTEHQRLLTAYQGRERARLDREAYLKANPPQPKNITLNYWRTERPAATKGGAR